MNDDGSVEATKNKVYEIVSDGFEGISIKNNSEQEHYFDRYRNQPSYYGKWFYRINYHKFLEY